MYSNAGKLLKKYTEIIVKIYYALMGICAAFLVIAGIASGSVGDFITSLIIAALVFGLGCLGAWISGMFLYAYGEMADRLIKIDEKMESLMPNRVSSEQLKSVTSTQNAKMPCGRFCESCGSPISENAKFCTECGNAIQ